MNHATLQALRDRNPAWRLLASPHAPLIASFLHRVFVAPNERVMHEADLAEALEDELFALREQMGTDDYPKIASEYLNDWAAPDKGWLRKFYKPGTDEAQFDLTPATEKAIAWLLSLTERPFVGTESRLLTLFSLLEQISAGTETDPVKRVDDLRRKRDELNAEIARVEAGDVPLLDDTAVKDRFQQFQQLARELLADFREVEHNFRLLDRKVREKIALWEGAKGALLDEVMGERDAISNSDQGRSFRAFWDFLMSSRRQEELSDRLDRVLALEAPPANVGAMIVEPVLGEGGYVPPPRAWLEGLRERCDEHGILLIFDEVITGFGRLGKGFATEYFGVKPDLITVAKALGNGFPCGALLMMEKAAAAVKMDALGTTFGASGRIELSVVRGGVLTEENFPAGEASVAIIDLDAENPEELAALERLTGRIGRWPPVIVVTKGFNADVGRRQRRRVVDAITGHRHAPALRLQALHQCDLVLRPHLAMHLVDAEAARDRTRGGPAVAGGHDDAQAEATQRRDRFRRRGLDRIGHGDEPGKCAIDGQEHHAVALGPQGFGGLGERRGVHAHLVHQRGVAECDRASGHVAAHADAGR